MNDLCINDVSLRDGIQSESTFIPMALRLDIVEDLIASGIRSLQVASFVNPKRVPQMQGIEAFIDLLPNKEAIAYSGLVLNEAGLRRLLTTALKQVDLSLSCSDTHSRKNTGLGLDEARKQIRGMIASAKKSDLFVRVGLQCVFGCHYQGAIPLALVEDLVRDMASEGADAISLADSTGQAVPPAIRTTVAAVQTITAAPIILHLHDTLGLGIANFLAGYEAGVRSFDASLGGVGGCPFIPGASGNIALEDLVHLCDRLNISTGVTLAPLIRAAKRLEFALDIPLPGKIHRLIKEPSHGADSRI